MMHSAEFGGRGMASVQGEEVMWQGLRRIEHTLDFRGAVASYALIVEFLDFLFLGR
jgi:hypothetical protein